MITQLGLLLVFFFLNIFFWKYKNFYTQNLMSFHSFKLNHKIEAFLNLTCYFCFYILGFLYLCFGYFGHRIDVIKDSQQNRNVFYAIMNSSLLDYLKNDLIIRKTESELLVLKRLTSMYRRYIILFILFIFIVYLNIIKDTFIVYLGTVTIPINIVLFPLFFFSIFISAKTYYNFEEKDPAELEFYKYKFNKYYNLFFWLLILFQLFILCMTIFYRIMV